MRYTLEKQIPVIRKLLQLLNVSSPLTPTCHRPKSCAFAMGLKNSLEQLSKTDILAIARFGLLLKNFKSKEGPGCAPRAPSPSGSRVPDRDLRTEKNVTAFFGTRGKTSEFPRHFNNTVLFFIKNYFPRGGAKNRYLTCASSTFRAWDGLRSRRASITSVLRML